LKHDVKKFFKKNEYKKIVEHMSNDKKNNDKRINLILLKKIGETTLPNSYKISSQELKKKIDKII
jgi:3-dehydroquinate synthetase